MKMMITNGGPHPADKFADVSTESILDLIQIAEDAISGEATAARKAKRDLRPVLFDIFNTHHESVQYLENSECQKVKKHAEAHARAHAPVDVTPHLSVMDEVAAALAATPFAAHFAKPEVIEVVKQIVARDTANVMHIERRYHSDRIAKGA